MLLFAHELQRRFQPFWPRAVGACLLALLGSGSTVAAAEEQGLVVRSFLSDPPICRAGRPVSLTAVVVNDGRADAGVNATLTLPPGVRLLAPEAPAPVRISMTEGEQQLRFVVEAQAGGPAEIVLDLATPGGAVVRQPLAVDFLPPVVAHKLDAVPPAEPVAPDMLVGAIHCPLWEADRVDLWRGVLRHPERMPALGLYTQENPQVADWEAKWALEHGISFFVYCWYRDGEGGPVKTRFSRGLVIGGFAPGTRAHFTGLVDEVRLFSRALSTAEVRICWQASARPAAVGDDATRPERK